MIHPAVDTGFLAIQACLRIAKEIQDREWSEDMQHVVGTYATGYADAAGDIIRQIKATFPEVKEEKPKAKGQIEFTPAKFERQA